jgi:hypothetical protein
MSSSGRKFQAFRVPKFKSPDGLVETDEFRAFP